MSITLWKPEPDVLIHQALGKLAEECAELSQALARCLIQGYREEEPVTHKLNRIQVREEMADVKAAMRWLSELVNEQWGESPREARKLAGFQQWQHMLEADTANPPPAPKPAPASSNAWHTACINILWPNGATHGLFDKIKDFAEAIERGEVYPSSEADLRGPTLAETDAANAESGATAISAILDGAPIPRKIEFRLSVTGHDGCEIVLLHWPEGYALQRHGEIVWREWVVPIHEN